ncbi:ABC transporter substrate-binding protein [Streptomyces sp. A73]|nr:ABC transporter substrate-binding protein [Streptomyces sp. A73]
MLACGVGPVGLPAEAVAAAAEGERQSEGGDEHARHSGSLGHLCAFHRSGPARALGVSATGERLRKRTGKRIDAVRNDIPQGGGARGAEEKGGDRPRVAFLYLRGSASVYLLGGSRSGASSLIEAAGGVDAGKESGLKKDFTAITSEALAKAAPDVILVMTKGLDSVHGVEGLLKIPGVAQTPAGRHRRIATIDDGVLLNYGPRTDQVLRDLAAQIHAKGGRP